MSKLVKDSKEVLYQVFCLRLGLTIIAPIIYAFFISFMPSEEILSIPPRFIPSRWILDNYQMAWELTPLGRFMINSLILAGVSSIIRVITAGMAAYAFAFYDFKGKNLVFLLFMDTIMVPGDVVLVTNYQTVSKLKLIDTYLGMMIVFLVSANNVFMMRQYFLTFSKELKEASKVDGCSNLRFFMQILLPLSTPIITTIFITEWEKVIKTGGYKPYEDDINEEFSLELFGMAMMSTTRIGKIHSLVGNKFNWNVAALPKVKALADYVATSNHATGVYEAVLHCTQA